MVSDRIVNILRASVTIVAALLLILLTADDAGFGTANEAAHPQRELAAPGEPANSQNVETSASSDAEQAAGASQAAVAADNAALTASAERLQQRDDAVHTETLTLMQPEENTEAHPEEPSEEPVDEDAEPAGVHDVDTGTALQKIAYITVDDGPSRAITPGMLDVLEEEGIKATFFVLPHGGLDDLYRRIIDDGHEIGNHSYTHIYSRLYKPGDLETFREDVLRARDYILENFGYLTTTFRFPGGAMGRDLTIIEPRREVLDELGYRYFDWNSDTGDAGRSADKSATALTRNVLNNTRGRERLIVIMHDISNKRTTLEALPMIIEGLREQGYVFDVLGNYDAPDPNP